MGARAPRLHSSEPSRHAAASERSDVGAVALEAKLAAGLDDKRLEELKHGAVANEQHVRAAKPCAERLAVKRQQRAALRHPAVCWSTRLHSRARGQSAVELIAVRPVESVLLECLLDRECLPTTARVLRAAMQWKRTARQRSSITIGPRRS